MLAWTVITVHGFPHNEAVLWYWSRVQGRQDQRLHFWSSKKLLAREVIMHDRPHHEDHH